MRTYLQTPFAEKDQAKALGARWDAARRQWYVAAGVDLQPFARWMTTEVGAPPTATRPQSRGQPAQAVVTHSERELPSCDCAVLPWEPCPHSAS